MLISANPSIQIPLWQSLILATLCAASLLFSGCGSLHNKSSEKGRLGELRDDLKSVLTTLKNETAAASPFPPPSHQRIWRPDLALLPYAEFTENQVAIRNVRNCRYRTEEDYDVRHYDLRFQLYDVRTVDFIVVPFKTAPMLAHTMLSFGLADGRHFVISVEARLEQGEQYTPSGGSMHAYELIYLIGDERDLVLLRTEVRNVDVYLYPGNASPDQVQDLLVDMLRRVNSLASKPEYYDTLTNNCTTNIVDHINHLRPGTIRLDPRVLLPGHSDRLAFELGLIKVNGTFEELRARSKINISAYLYQDDPQFSDRIRGSRPD